MSLASGVSDSSGVPTLDDRIEVEEHEELVIEKFPKDIAKQLERAAFKPGDSKNTYIKHQESALDSSKISVVEVKLEEDQLVISVGNAVGIINLTPNSKLQINPKIGWNHILKMFLAVQEKTRTFDYHGIPIREFLADDLGIEDVFIIVAANYLNSLQSLFQNGFVRRLETKRVEAIQASGRIDIERSLRNNQLSNGVPKQHFIQREVNYNVTVNSLVYRAGIELLRLFQLYSQDYLHSGYFRVFSQLEDALRRMEKYGIVDDQITPRQAAELSIGDLHPQRHYYRDAIQVSKTILSSTIGEPLDEGREELTMDYILSMDTLFEKYSQSVLESKIKELSDDPRYPELDDIEVNPESLSLFSDTNQYRVDPDHVIRQDSEPIAIIDSKYYAMSHSPLKDTYARSRLLGYGYRLEVNELAFLCPLNSDEEHPFEGREGNLRVIAPSEFSTDLFEERVRSYLHEIFDISANDILIDELEKRIVCHPKVDDNSIDVLLSSEFLEAKALVADAYSILRYSTKLSHTRLDAIDINPSYHKVQEYLEQSVEGYDYAVPLFISSGEEIPKPTGGQENEDETPLPGYSDEDKECERIQVHCFNVTSDGGLKDWKIMPPLVIDWKK
ncbi:hypothetical protein A4G99_19645 [Haladaptatus sp. R4]|uniref:5-methylcytosine restriction system specificity protein McrC n=1 Tax=Haladaptatus sp. R4 TaxID=1679489 RepID=UPI0007B49AC5|nr:hypothetical protein [Haladaptatus sp. R4]KZN22666.1 hypothetical protein A4G99_19645 [Haladaptatus sp. R4]